MLERLIDAVLMSTHNLKYPCKSQFYTKVDFKGHFHDIFGFQTAGVFKLMHHLGKLLYALFIATDNPERWRGTI